VPGARFDLYFAQGFPQRWQWRRVYSEIKCNSAGEATFSIPIPDPSAGFYQFKVLNAADDDGDGLSNGYEAWFTYNGQKTMINDPESDLDTMFDGWEVAYGINPTSLIGADGGGGNPDGDAFSNVQEYNDLFAAPSYDPLKPFGSTQQGQLARPVVSISTANPDVYKLGGTATFRIQRSIGLGADLSQPLTVYYSVGGSAVYGTDYSLNPTPSEYPRIFSAAIPAGETEVTVTVTPIAGGIQQAGTQTIVPKLTPFGVAVVSQIADPLLWGYVVDLHHEAVTVNIHNGILINLEKAAPDGFLRIKPVGEATPLPFINVANSVRGTVARIYTGADPASDPSRGVGEYFTAPNGRGRDPSRTTVDRYGNVWVGNRAELGGDGNGGSITQVGFVIGGTRCNSDGSPNPNGDFLKPPFIHNTCVDRNGDGLIHTARGANLQLPWSNAGNADSLGGVSTADDEAILRYLRVVPIGVRTIVVDPNNNLWIGSYQNGWNEFIDTVAGMQVTGRRLSFPASGANGGGYGAVIGRDGAVWSSGFNGLRTGLLLRFQPGNGMPVTSGGTIRNTVDNYGITVDPLTGDVWQPINPGSELIRFGADHCTARFPIGQTGNRGIVVDGQGNVWVGGSGFGNSSTIFHLTTSGSPVGTVPMTFSSISGDQPLGVAVDSSGMVWAICYNGTGNNGYAMRIDPSRGTIPPGSDRPVGQVVEAVNLGTGTGPYNYSDMSGFVTLSTAQPSGVWDHVEDSGADETLWTSLNMDAVIEAQTRIVVEVRAANKITDLPSWPFRAVVNAAGVTPPGTTTLPAGIKGRYVEVRANLLRDFGVTASPELRSLTLQHGGAGCAVNITAHPRSQAVSPGANVSFMVTAQPPPSATATYQWFKDGILLSNGGNISGATTATLTINNDQYTDAARYSVKVGTVSGCTFQVESSPARLHVKGNPPTVTQDLPASLTVTESQNATLTAQAAAGSNAGEKPIYYQWRFNNEPIAGASGDCGTGNCNINRVVAGQCANAGLYSVVFWNQYGQIATVNCELRISGKNSLDVTPSSVSVTSPNQNVTFTATTCLGSLNCIQWFRTPPGGQKTAIPGANSLTYTIPTPITCDKLGTYTVSVGDTAWNAYEASATVSASPQSASIASTTLKITPANIGTGEWTYQWSDSDNDINYSPIPGATTDTYTPSQTRYYKVVATRSGATAEVRVHYNQTTSPIVTAKASQNGDLSVTYTPQVSGVWAGSSTYHWYFSPEGGGPQQDLGLTGGPYTIGVVDCTKRGYYQVDVSGNCGVGIVLSAYASLSMDNPSASITSSTLKITPANIGTGEWTYQWSDSDNDITYSPIPGATTDSYMPSQTRYYKVVATRTDATAEGRFLYYQNTSPQVTAKASQEGTLSVTYSATPSAIGPYRWYFLPEGGSNEQDTGITSSQYSVDPVDCTRRGTYRFVVHDGCSGSVSAYATLLVDTPSVSGASATLKITPANIGTGEWTYQWSDSDNDINYSPIPGATTDSYTPSQPRYYKGVATRSGATAEVRLYYINIGSSPYVQRVADPQDGTLSVTYTPQVKGVGTGSWTYHWYFTPEVGGPVQDLGVNSGPYTIGVVDCTKRGYYQVDVSDSCGAGVDLQADAFLVVDNCP
jgi:hypothetical protein